MIRVFLFLHATVNHDRQIAQRYRIKEHQQPIGAHSRMYREEKQERNLRGMWQSEDRARW